MINNRKHYYVYIGTGDNNDVCLQKDDDSFVIVTEIEFRRLLKNGDVVFNK